MDYAQIFDDPIFIETTFVFIVVLLIALYYRLYKVMIALVGVYIVYVGIILINQDNQATTVIQPPEVITESTVLEKPEQIEDDQPKPAPVQEKIKQKSSSSDNTNKPEAIEQKPASIKSNLEVTNIVICRNVISETRTAVGSGENFPNNINRLYCFSSIRNMTEKQEIIHNWYYGDQMISSVPMIIGWSYNWRTWSYQTILPKNTGLWSVTIVDSQNRELVRIQFTISTLTTDHE